MRHRSSVSNPTIAPCWQSFGGRARSVGKASNLAELGLSLLPWDFFSSAPIYPLPWEKALPSSNQCLSFKMQWVVAGLELQSLRFAALETDLIILVLSENEE